MIGIVDDGILRGDFGLGNPLLWAAERRREEDSGNTIVGEEFRESWCNLDSIPPDFSHTQILNQKNY